MTENKDKTYLELNLPKSLQYDIDELIKGEENNSSLMDCLFEELSASVNWCENDRSITREQAEFLREKYL